jgi:hypothetical protein
MADHLRLLTRACDHMCEAQMQTYSALTDGVITPDEAMRIVAEVNEAYALAEQAEAVEVGYERARKLGINAVLNRPSREKIAAILQFRERKQPVYSKTAPMAYDGPNDAA